MRETPVPDPIPPESDPHPPDPEPPLPEPTTVSNVCALRPSVQTMSMVRKKMEGNEEQRRKKAREARRRGRLPSEERATEGASKQRRHLPDDADHAEKLNAIRQGKQPDPGIHVSEPKPRPGSRT